MGTYGTSKPTDKMLRVRVSKEIYDKINESRGLATTQAYISDILTRAHK